MMFDFPTPTAIGSPSDFPDLFSSVATLFLWKGTLEKSASRKTVTRNG
jgi:hypothetical protein